MQTTRFAVIIVLTQQEQRYMKTIAHIYNGFETKFGIPRQSGLCELTSQIIFEKEYQNRKDSYTKVENQLIQIHLKPLKSPLQLNQLTIYQHNL